MMGNCCLIKRPNQETNQIMPIEEYEYSNIFFLGDLEEEQKIFTYNNM